MTQAAYLSLTLSRYIAKRYFGGFLLTLAALSVIIFLAEILELIRRASSQPDVTFQLVLQMTVLKFPHTLQKLIPFAALLGGMFVFWRLNRSSELVVARASGVSVWQICVPAVVIAGSIGVFFITVINPLGSTMLLRFEQMENDYFKGKATQLAISRSGMWLRQANDKTQSVIHAVRMTSEDMTLRDVTVYLFDDKNQFVQRLDASDAHLAAGTWELKNVLVTTPGKLSKQEAAYSLPTNWTAAKIKDSFSPPETLSFWHLPGFIELLDKAGFTATRHRVYWYSLLAIPIMMIAMVLIAASFSLRLARRGGVAILAGSGILFSFFILFVSDVVHALGLANTIPALLAAWTPTWVTLLIGLSILLFIEEG